MSIDGYGAGPSQNFENPLGVGGLALHDWAFKTHTLHATVGNDDGEPCVDDDFFAPGFDNIGAWIIGRNLFGPVPALGWTTLGRDGGAKIRRITLLSSFSPNTRAGHASARSPRDTCRSYPSVQSCGAYTRIAACSLPVIGAAT